MEARKESERSQAVGKPLSPEGIWREDSAVAAEWVKARVYGMSWRLYKQLKGFPLKKPLILNKENLVL